jgi:flagellar biosynthetic protein FliR
MERRMTICLSLLVIRFFVGLLVIPGGWSWLGLVWRAMAAVVLSLVTLPAISARNPVTAWSTDVPWSLLPAVAQEVVLGLALGTGLSLIWSSASLIGRLAWSGTLADAGPEADTDPGLRMLMTLVAVAFFFGIRGDHLLIRQVLLLCDRFPVAEVQLSRDWAAPFVQILTAVFRFSLGLALPLIATNLMAHLALGFLLRSVPEFLVPGVGRTVQLAAMTCGLALLLTGLAWIYRDQTLVLQELLFAIGNG